MSVKNEKKKATEQSLLEAAIAVFHKKGYQATRVSDIVSQAGMAQGSFYNYFRSKQDVFKRVGTDFIESFSQVLEEAESRFKDLEPENTMAKFRLFVKDLLLVRQKNQLVAEIMFREGMGHGGPVTELFENLYKRFTGIIKSRIENMNQRGILFFPNPEQAAVFMVGLFERSWFYFLIKGQAVDLDELADNMARFILHGLKGPVNSE